MWKVLDIRLWVYMFGGAIRHIAKVMDSMVNRRAIP